MTLLRKLFLFLAITAAVGLGLAGAALVAPLSAMASAWAPIQLTSASGVVSAFCAYSPYNDNGSPVVVGNIATCEEDGYGEWFAEPSSYGTGWYQIVNSYSHLCLGDSNGGGDGTQVVIWSCNGGRDQAMCPAQYHSSYWPVAWEFATGYAMGAQNDAADGDGSDMIVWSVNWSNSEAWAGPNDTTYSC